MPGCARPLALTLLLAAACGSKATGTGTPSDPNPIATATAVGTPIGPAATKTIGVAGGTISSADGDLSIVVPPATVATDTEFFIQPVVNMAPGGLGRVFRLRPEGVTFANPIALTLKAAGQYPSGTGIGNLGISYQDAAGYWHRVAVTRDAGANTISTSATHFSDWGVAWVAGTPVLQGAFTLNQTYDAPFSATGTAALYLQSDTADETVYVLTGNITIPPSLQLGTATCTTSTPTITMPMSIAEVVKSSLKFRWGLNGLWGLACTDNSTGATFSRVIGTAFDTMQINLVTCPGTYVGTQTVGPGELAGSYTSDCGAQGQVTASWDFLTCSPGATCQSSSPCLTATITCPSGPSGAPVCADTGNSPDGAACGASEVCSAGACVACTPGTACTPANPCDAGTLDCSAGPVCNDTTTPLLDGTLCGAGLVCELGTCGACVQGAPCATNPCVSPGTGTLDCSAAVPVCTGPPLADGTTCGNPGQTCTAGICGP